MERKYYSGGEGKPPIWIQPIIESGRMYDQDFFRFTDMLDWDKQGDDEAVVEPLIAFLAKWGDNVIFAFHDKMAELLFSLDTYNIAKHLIENETHFSPDYFLYARCVALVNGKPYYNSILKGEKNWRQIWILKPFFMYRKRHGKGYIIRTVMNICMRQKWIMKPIAIKLDGKIVL